MAKQDLTPHRQRIDKGLSIEGGNHQNPPRPSSAMKLATGLNKMPGQQGIPEVTGADGVLSSLLLGGKYKRKRERAESGIEKRVGRERTSKTSSAWANGKGALIK